MRTALCLTLLLIALGLSACALHARDMNQTTRYLHTLQLVIEPENTHLRAQLGQQLTHQGIQVASQAPYILRVDQIRFEAPVPAITTTALLISVTYRLSMRVTLKDQAGKIFLPPRVLSATYTLSHSSHQAYTLETAQIIRAHMRDRLITQLLDGLSSQTLAKRLAHASE